MKARFWSRPLIPFLVFYIFGILSSSRFPDYFLWAVAGTVISAGWILTRLIGNTAAGVSPLLLFFSLGYLSLLPWVKPDLPAHHLIHRVDNQPWEVTGTVDSAPFKSNGRVKFYLAAETFRRQASSFPVTGRIRVTVWGHLSALTRGDRISFVGRVRSVHNFNNPGGFDFKRAMRYKGVLATAYVQQNRVHRLQAASPSGVRPWIEGIRRNISLLIERVPGADRQGALKALVIGDRQALPKSLRESFNRAGVGHLLAISGLHMGIVAAAAFSIFSWMLSRFQGILRHAWTKKGAALLSLFPVLAYGLLAGMSPSTQRAAIMVGLFLMTYIIEAEQDTMNTLAVAALSILVVFPPSLYSISFQLSFTAVGSIIYGLNRLGLRRSITATQPDPTAWDRFRKKLVIFILVSAFAYIGTLPLVTAHFNQMSLVAPVVNLLVVPLVGFVAVPLGLTAAFLSLISGPAALWGFQLTAAVLAPGLDMVRFFSDLPFAAIKTVTPSALEIACFYGLAGSVLHLATSTRASNVEDAGNDGGFGRIDSMTPVDRNSDVKGRFPAIYRVCRQARPVPVVLVVCILVLFADAVYWGYQRFWHDDLRVTVMDVGQGSAALLEMPGGTCVLVDGGGFSDNDIFDVGARIVAPVLWGKKIATIDLMVLSHPNSDHLNGLLYIARHFNVHTLWSNHEAAETRAYDELMAIAAQNAIRMPIYRDVARGREINGVRLEVLYPAIDFLETTRFQKWRNANNNSLVLKVGYGAVSFLFPGDIMKRGEAELVRTKGDALKATVLMAPHHGSRTSSSRPFLEAVDPKVAIISAGWHNRFGFPHEAVLKTYSENGYRVLRTDRHGAVFVSSDGKSLKIDHRIR